MGPLARLALALALLGSTTARASAEQAEVAPLSSSQATPTEVSALHALRYHYANDTFTSTDYYFTQGMGFRYTAPALAGSPLALPLPELGDDAVRQVSLSWRYEGFTPIEFDRREIQFGDRPFASYMYLAHESERLARDGAWSLAARWALGYLGPRVGGQQFQAEIHRFTEGKSPRGWRNQLDDDLVAQLEARADYRVLGARYLDLRLEVGVRGGTLYTDASLGARVRAGLLGPAIGAPGSDPDAGSFRLYAWAAARGTLVGFNATLQGGVFGDSDYTLSANALRRALGRVEGGATLEVGAFGFTWSVTAITPEFRRGRSHAWGQFAITIFFS